MVSRLYDPIRKKHVAATPEELVRQRVIGQMIRLGYPASLMAVEKALQNRRFDLVCYGRQIHPLHELHPLILIECKAERLTQEAREQVYGYNASVGAPFVAVAGEAEIYTLWFDGAKIASVPFLPPFHELVERARQIL